MKQGYKIINFRIFFNKLLLILILFSYSFLLSQYKHSSNSIFNKFDKMLMVGYQGWFSAKGDSANIGWYKYAKDWKLNSNECNFDLWPDTSEYKKLYKTDIIDSQDKNKYLFSSNDESTIDLHLKWMKDYNIDGLFLQRFFLALHDATREHHLKVLKNIKKYTKVYKVAYSIMYDIGGIKSEQDVKVLKDDWKFLVDSLKITSESKNTYLFNNNKPVVGIVIAGLKGDNNLKYINEFINFLKNDKEYGNCSIVIGTPYNWRTLDGDSSSDLFLLNIISKSDFVMPWSVGRVKENNFEIYKQILLKDKTWCEEKSVNYLPVIYPGFSWHNMNNNSPFDEISRKNGSFYKKMIATVKSINPKNVYIAMFDEINEGTAIFKIDTNPPKPKNLNFISNKSISNDYFLLLSRELANYLKK